MPNWLDVMKFLAAEDDRVVWLSALVAVVVVVAPALIIKDWRERLAKPLGAVGWSFTDSWASTLTEVGALLGVLVAAQLVGPEVQPLSGTDLAGLSLLFGALAAVAPLVFNAISELAPDTPNAEGPLYRGYVWGFLLACIVTLWAVLGELATLAILLREATTLPHLVSITFQSMAGVASVLVVIYAWRTMGGVIRYRAAKTTIVAFGPGGSELTGQAGWKLL